jgi:hypothetical protein
MCVMPSGIAAERPSLQIINGSEQSIEIFWAPAGMDRVSNGRLEPGQQTTIRTEIGHQFAVVAQSDGRESMVTCELPVQSFRYDPNSIDGIPSFYTQRVFVHGYPIVASSNVNPFALKEAAYWVDQMLADRPDIRDAMIRSGSRMCIMAWNEYTTDLPEFRWLAREKLTEFPDLDPKDYWDARARGLGGSENDPLCSCAEENLLAYSGDPYASECILIHEFAHNIHLRGLINIDPSFDQRLRDTYDKAMKMGLWRGTYASVNHYEYFAEGVQSWFDNNRENDHDHNHVNTRTELESYDPGLAAICKEVFGETRLTYTKPTLRRIEHLEGFDPSSSPTFSWPSRLKLANERIVDNAIQRSQGSR